MGTNLPANEKDHVCMRITFYCLITNTKKFFFWWIREEILYLSYIHHDILLLKLYCVSLLLNIYTFYRRMWKCRVADPIKYHYFSYWLPQNIFIEHKTYGPKQKNVHVLIYIFNWILLFELMHMFCLKFSITAVYHPEWNTMYIID